MKRWVWCIGVIFGALMQGGAEPPHIGYAYPMGGQQDSSYEAIVGGQYLEGAERVEVSGEGVRVEVLDYFSVTEKRQLGRYRNTIKNKVPQLEEMKKQGKDPTRLEAQIELARAKIAAQEKALEEIKKLYHPTQLREMKVKKQFNPQIADSLKVRITVDSSAPVGARELRVRTAEGLSNPIVFQVGSLPEVREEEPNDDHHDADLKVLSVPILINGQVMPGDIDCFRFKAHEGEMMVVDVSARKLIPYLADAVPGWFQAVVALYDNDGEEMAFTDDYKFNPDPVLFYRVPKEGSYTLQIKDAIYRGREDFVYRIAVGELPFITSIFPLGAQAGKPVDLQLRGVNLPQHRLKGQLPNAEVQGAVRQITMTKEGYRSNGMPFALGTYPEKLEQEPNDSVEEAQPVRLPVVVNGRIQVSGDEDVFQFKGRKGDTVAAEVHARRLLSPVDSLLMLTGPGLKSPVINDDHVDEAAGLTTHHADSYLTCELPATGTYYLRIRDTQLKGGEEYGYRLRISPAQPDFDLRLEPSGMSITPGGTGAFTVHAIRKDGFAGKIRIAAKSLPDGFRMSAAEVPEGADLTRFTITAPEELKSSEVYPLMVGEGFVKGKKVTHEAVPVEDQMQAFLYRHLVPSQELVLSPIEEEAALSFEAVVPQKGYVELPVDGSVKVKLRGHYNGEKLNGGVKLELSAPPEGIRLGKSNLWKYRKSKQQELRGQLVLQADDSLKPGDRMTLVVEALIKRGREQLRLPAPAISVRMVEAVEEE